MPPLLVIYIKLTRRARRIAQSQRHRSQCLHYNAPGQDVIRGRLVLHREAILILRLLAPGVGPRLIQMRRDPVLRLTRVNLLQRFNDAYH